VRSHLPLLLALCASASAAQDPVPVQVPPIFATQVDSVYVDAFVTHRRDPVNGLVASDFELKDNGVIQKVELVSTEALPLLAVLVFDSSSSVAGEKLKALQASGRAFLESLRPQDEVSLFTFSGTTMWPTRPTTDKAAVRQALDGLQTGGGTSAFDALFTALVLPETRGRPLVLLFTDGLEDNMSFLDWKQMQLVAERSNALIHVIGLKQEENLTVAAPQLDIAGRMLPAASPPSLEWIHTWGLRQIAEASGGRYWEAESPQRLKAAFGAIAESMAQRYVLTYEPEGVKRPGWHDIELRLKERPGDVHARRGYWVAGPGAGRRP
jgi:VWFA-related protein